MPWISDSREGCIIAIHASPRSSRNDIHGVHGNALKVRLIAPPVDGKANRALMDFLADCLGIPPGRLELLGGETGRRKRVLARHLPAAQARERLQKYLERLD
jgi:uncharacterized protein (TIGR00251 family)